MKKITLIALTIFTLILTACGSASNTPQAGPANQDRTLPVATQLIIGIFKLDGTDQAVTAEQAKELLPLWQVYQDLLTSDTAAQEEIDALVEQAQETLTADQTQAISAMNLTQRDIFALMQEKGLGMTQRSNPSGGNGTGNGTNFEGGGFAPPDGGMMPAGGPPDGGGFPGGGFQSNSQSESNTQSRSDSTSRPAQINPASLLLDPLIELLKEKIGVN